VQAGDSAGSKLSGSLLNALVFVAIITVMTFIIVLLFKYGVCLSQTVEVPNSESNNVVDWISPLQCVKFIYAYMGFATFMIFFFLTGGILLDFLQTIDAKLDAISCSFILYNFSIVGSTVLFFQPAPLLQKQVCGDPCVSSRNTLWLLHTSAMPVASCTRVAQVGSKWCRYTLCGLE
jgi:presenilin 1